MLDRSSFLKDSLLGERVVHLSQILEHYHGRCDNLELVMDLLGSLKPEGRTKSGEIVVVLNGLKIDGLSGASGTGLGSAHHTVNGVSNGLSITTSAVPSSGGGSGGGGGNNSATNSSNGSTVNCPQDANSPCMNGRSTILCSGIRARVRLRTNNNSNSILNPANGHPIAGVSLSADAGSYMLGARSINDLRNSRSTPNDPNNRRHNDFPDAQQHSRSVGNLGIANTNMSCGPSTSRNSGGGSGAWDPTSQAMVPCNGSPANQWNLMVFQ